MKTSLVVVNALFLFCCFCALDNSWAQNTTDQELMFNCHVPINPYDPNFQQGDEKFLKVFFHKSVNLISLQASDMTGVLPELKESLKWSYNINEDLSNLSARITNGYLSMVYLGNSYWGAFLKNQEIEDEFLCREILNLDTL